MLDAVAQTAVERVTQVVPVQELLTDDRRDQRQADVDRGPLVLLQSDGALAPGARLGLVMSAASVGCGSRTDTILLQSKILSAVRQFIPSRGHLPAGVSVRKSRRRETQHPLRLQRFGRPSSWTPPTGRVHDVEGVASCADECVLVCVSVFSSRCESGGLGCVGWGQSAYRVSLVSGGNVAGAGAAGGSVDLGENRGLGRRFGGRGGICTGFVA